MPAHVIAFLTLLAPHSAPEETAARSAPPAERTLRVGQITIEGADDMSASAVLREVGFRYGDEIPYSRLAEAEHRLARLGLFMADPATGVRPRITPERDGVYTGLRITVVKKEQGGRSP